MHGWLTNQYSNLTFNKYIHTYISKYMQCKLDIYKYLCIYYVCMYIFSMEFAARKTKDMAIREKASAGAVTFDET